MCWIYMKKYTAPPSEYLHSFLVSCICLAPYVCLYSNIDDALASHPKLLIVLIAFVSDAAS